MAEMVDPTTVEGMERLMTAIIKSHLIDITPRMFGRPPDVLAADAEVCASVASKLKELQDLFTKIAAGRSQNDPVPEFLARMLLPVMLAHDAIKGFGNFIDREARGGRGMGTDPKATLKDIRDKYGRESVDPILRKLLGPDFDKEHK